MQGEDECPFFQNLGDVSPRPTNRNKISDVNLFCRFSSFITTHERDEQIIHYANLDRLSVCCDQPKFTFPASILNKVMEDFSSDTPIGLFFLNL